MINEIAKLLNFNKVIKIPCKLLFFLKKYTVFHFLTFLIFHFCLWYFFCKVFPHSILKYIMLDFSPLAAQSVCPNGKTVYERIPGHRLQGFEERPVSQNGKRMFLVCPSFFYFFRSCRDCPPQKNRRLIIAAIRVFTRLWRIGIVVRAIP